MSAILKAFTFGKSKHKKLPEEWGEDIKQPVNEGLPFHCKYIGSTLVEKASDDATTAEAIKTIIQMAKMAGKVKNLRKVVLTIKPTGISCKDAHNDEEIFDISIYRISYCSADANYDRVVAFIATNKNETHECHAFLTRKNEVARACALTISQAFAIAFEKYQETLKEKNQTKPSNDSKDTKSNGKSTDQASNENCQTNGAPMIDLLSDSTPNLNGQINDLDADKDCFLRLAMSRARTVSDDVPLLPSNLTLKGFQDPNQLNEFIRAATCDDGFDKNDAFNLF